MVSGVKDYAGKPVRTHLQFFLPASVQVLYILELNPTNEDEGLSFVFIFFFPLKLAAGHWGLLEKTVSWRDEDLDFISRPTVINCFWLFERKVLFKCQDSNIKISLCSNKVCICITVWRENGWESGAVPLGIRGRECSQFSSSSELKNISVQMTPSIQ